MTEQVKLCPHQEKLEVVQKKIESKLEVTSDRASEIEKTYANMEQQVKAKDKEIKQL